MLSSRIWFGSGGSAGIFVESKIPRSSPCVMGHGDDVEIEYEK
jgi:hypothetical protein